MYKALLVIAGAIALAQASNKSDEVAEAASSHADSIGMAETSFHSLFYSGKKSLIKEFYRKYMKYFRKCRWVFRGWRKIPNCRKRMHYSRLYAGAKLNYYKYHCG
jgi:hypothetical protein